MNRGRQHSKGWAARKSGPSRAGGNAGRGRGRGGGRGRGRGGFRNGRGDRSQERLFVPTRSTIGADKEDGGMPVQLTFGNFAFEEMENVGQRGGGVRELSSLLRQARRRAKDQKDQLQSKEGIEERNKYLLGTALQRAAGQKVKDDPHKLTKALAKRRGKKRQSAKKWAKRLKNLEDSVENVVKDRTIAKQTLRARKDAKGKAKEKRKTAVKGLRTSAKDGKAGKGRKAKKSSEGWGKVK